MNRQQKILKERIHRVRVLYRELGYEVVGEEKALEDRKCGILSF